MLLWETVRPRSPQHYSTSNSKNNDIISNGEHWMLDKWYYPILFLDSVYKTLKWNGWKFLINIRFVANAENWETANMQCINFSQEWKWPNQNMMCKWYENNAIKNNFHSFLSIYILCDFHVHCVPSCVWQRYPMTRNLEGIIVSHPFCVITTTNKNPRTFLHA